MKSHLARAIAVCALSFIAAPAFAADFYVVQDTASMKCSVVDAKPTVATMKVIGDAKSYPTHADADTAMGKATACLSK